MTKKLFSVRDMVLCALFAAVLCVVSPFTLPIGPVPLSLCNFAVMVTGCVLGGLSGSVSAVVFVAVGALGLPVFAGGTGGLGHILSPTGGFILSYIPSAAVAGAFAGLGRGPKNRFLFTLTGCFLSVVLGYIIGATWYSFAANVPFSSELFSACVIPFLPFDALKCVCATLLSRLLCDRLKIKSSKKAPKV